MKNSYAMPPYRIKMVEPITLTDKETRKALLKHAGFNPFALRSEHVYIDLLTDSGTGAMSHHQWGALMIGDEAYAGSQSFYRFEEAVKDITGYNYIIPAHQGRGAEQVVLPLLVKHSGMCFISNTHFDTTRAHVELAGARAIDCVIKEAYETKTDFPFKGNFDLERLEQLIHEKQASNVAGIIMTITNNSAGGQPVSYENLLAVHHIARKHHIPLIIDGARYAENAFFIKQREKGFKKMSVKAIARKVFDLADIFLMSAKKDGLVNIGGIIAIKNDEALYQEARIALVPKEGFPTYGGLAGRDMDALAVGLIEGLDEAYLAHRIDQVRYLGDKLKKAGIPIQSPTGGHAVFVDAKKILPHIPYYHFPAQVLCNELYIESGVRAVEIGSLLLGRDPDTKENLESPMELLRLTIPRRTYEYAHLDHVAQGMIEVFKRRHTLKGITFETEPPMLRHFLATFRYVE